MGIFTSEKKLLKYETLIRETAEATLPEVIGFDFTLTSLKPPKKRTAKKVGKLVGMNLLLGIFGFYAQPKGDFVNPALFITCFKGAEIYLIPIGFVNDRLQPKPLSERCMRVTSDQVGSIERKGNKVTFNLKDGDPFTLMSKVGKGTVYSTPKGDVKFYEFLEGFDKH